MEFLGQFLDLVLHLDQHLALLIQNYGTWIYAILFLIIFCETGLVVTPFLPGDSLLFVAGTMAATGAMDVHGLFALLVVAAFSGDNTNYWIGHFVGPRVFKRQRSRLLNPAHLHRTQKFYEKHGGKTIVLARFMPIVRTFAPFVAGIGRMRYLHFVMYSFGGSVLWISFFVYGGYYFGNIPFVKNNLTAFILGVIVLSIMPAVIAFLREKFGRQALTLLVGRRRLTSVPPGSYIEEGRVSVTTTEKNFDPARPLAGRTAIVTGSGQNIGKAIALHFARAGANVVVNGHRKQEAIDNVVKEIEGLGGKAMACLADVSDAAAVADMVKKAQDKFGGVDIAVSNVSLRLHQTFYEITLDDWDRILKSNLSSAFYLARAVLPGMQKSKWGRIIHISGEDGFQGHIPGRAHNMVCKAGVHAFSKAVAIEFAADGITANTVSPGSIETTRDWSQYPKNWLEMRLGQIPMKKIGRVDDIAMACVSLAGDSGSYISGQVIHLNGGQFMSH